MKRSIMFGVLFLTALAVAASAQSTGGQTPSQSGSSDQVTVTGCLQRGDAAGAQEHRERVLPARAPQEQLEVEGRAAVSF